MTREDEVETRVRGLVDDFDRYVLAADKLVPFSEEQLAAHREALSLRHQGGSAAAAVADPRFVQSLRRTLIAWRLDARASRLVSEAAFTSALTAAIPMLVELEPNRIDAADLPDDLTSRLWQLIESLGVVTNDAKLVAGTKTLHHLLPELIPPMDRAWTGKFFSLHNPEWQGDNQRRTFFRLYRTFRRIAEQVDPQRLVTGERWRTSTTKVLDNALIGYCIVELDRATATDTHLTGAVSPDDTGSRVTFQVAGYPPAKGEALSMLGAGHPHGQRVKALLEAARDALAAHPGFAPITSGRVGLDVVVHTAPGAVLSDATNYLGGIGDVLESKTHRGAAIRHLGDLADVWLYHNDRQIKEVTYREEEGNAVSYQVTVLALDA